MNKLIEFISVFKEYGNGLEKTTALKDVSLTVNEGDYLAIVGPSGAGKSTLLHIMGGIDSPTRGQVLFEGNNAFSFGRNPSLWRNKNIGFVFQFYHLIEELRTIENIALPHLLSGESRKTSFKRAQKLLEYLAIKRKVNSVPSQLSGGEKQKVAIARALINEPRVILCDEPTGNLDKASAEKVIRLLESLNRENKKTLIIVTHNLELAKRANLIINIESGQIIK